MLIGAWFINVVLNKNDNNKLTFVEGALNIDYDIALQIRELLQDILSVGIETNNPQDFLNEVKQFCINKGYELKNITHKNEILQHELTAYYNNELFEQLKKFLQFLFDFQIFVNMLSEKY